MKNILCHIHIHSSIEQQLINRERAREVERQRVRDTQVFISFPYRTDVMVIGVLAIDDDNCNGSGGDGGSGGGGGRGSRQHRC